MVATEIDCVSPLVNNAEPWACGKTPTSIDIGLTVSKSLPSILDSPDNNLDLTISDSKDLNWLRASSIFSSSGSSKDVLTFSLNSAIFSCLLDFSAIWYASDNSSEIRLLTFSFVSVSSSLASYSIGEIEACETNSSISSRLGCISAWAKRIAPSIWSSESSFASDSTINIASCEPATIIFKEEFSRSSKDGFRT